MILNCANSKFLSKSCLKELLSCGQARVRVLRGSICGMCPGYAWGHRTLGDTLVLQGHKQSRHVARLKVMFVLAFTVLKQEFVNETIGQISTYLAPRIFGY